MTRVVTFYSRGLYGCENFRDCLLIETIRKEVSEPFYWLS